MLVPFRYVLRVLAVLLAPTGAFALTVLDQQNDPRPPLVFGQDPSAQWQQGVTTGVAGKLTGIDIYFTDITENPAANGSFEITVYRGAAWQSGSSSFTSTASVLNGWNHFNVASAGLAFGVGEQFSIGVRPIGDPLTQSWLSLSGSQYFLPGVDPYYPGGALYANGGARPDIGSDMAFRTYVDTLDVFSATRQITLPGQLGTNQVSFDGTKFVVRLDIALTGATASQSIQSEWETGIEKIWNSNGYRLTEGGSAFDLIFDVNFVDSGFADFSVNVINPGADTLCQTSSLSWCLSPWIDTVSAREDLRGVVAAHEFGHLLGLWDEYQEGNTDPTLTLADKLKLCIYTLEVGVWCDSLMADYGPVQDRYIDGIVEFLSAAAGERPFVLGRNPLAEPYLGTDLGPHFRGIVEPPRDSTTVPEPWTLFLVVLGLFFAKCRFYARPTRGLIEAELAPKP